MRPVEENDPRPPSVQIADDLRERIESGEFAAGSKLPSIRALATQYGVAQMTANGALQRLRDEGRAYTSGRGHFVGRADSGNSSDLAESIQEIQAEIRELRSRIETLESAQ